MTYQELLDRCVRLVGFSKDAQPSLIDCVNGLHQYQLSHSRGVIGEGLAREMAEYIEQHRTVPEGAKKQAMH